MNPLVSIIIPTYNRAHLIAYTLKSVQNQSYQNWECIIIDDGSTDDTKSIVQKFSNKDPRFQYHYKPQHLNSGGNAARNYGYEISKGAYINWLDSDDLLSDRKIESQVELLEHEPSSLKIATCKWGIFKYDDQAFKAISNLKVYKSYYHSHEFINDLYEQFGYFPPHAYLLSRALIEKAGKWNEYLTINQDGEFFTRVICSVEKILFEKNVSVWYRETRNDSVSLLNKDKIKDYYNSWKLIEASLNIRYKDNNITNFTIIKEKAFNRIPKEMAYIYLKDRAFFHNQIKEHKLKNRLPNRIFRFIKARLLKLF